MTQPAKPKSKRKRKSAYEEARESLTIDFFTALTVGQCEDRLRAARKPDFIPGRQAVEVYDNGQFTLTIWTGLNPLPYADKNQHGIPLKFHGTLQVENGQTRVRGQINEKFLKYIHDPLGQPRRIGKGDVIVFGIPAVIYGLMIVDNLDNALGWLLLVMPVIAVMVYAVNWLRTRRTWRQVAAVPGQFAAWIEDLLYEPY